MPNCENPAQIMRSWNLQGTFASGEVKYNKLVPQPWKRIDTLFLQTWREETVSNVLDWGAQNFSFYLPESLRVLSSMYLEIQLPALSGGGSYKAFPALYVIDRLRFLTAGREAYTVDVGLHLRDYLESLETEECKQFADLYLGGTTATAAARTIMVPILLPNSAYWHRHGRSGAGHGVFPCFTGVNRIELQITMNTAAYVVTDITDQPASIAGAMKMMYHVVNMKQDDEVTYNDQRGRYSVYNRRFHEITDGWTPVAANVEHSIVNNKPLGCVTELFALAVDETAADIADTQLTYHGNVIPNHFEIITDSCSQKELDSLKKNEIELWTNGFIGNDHMDMPGRLCFAAHAAESDANFVYTGGYNMKLTTNYDVRIKFPKKVKYRVFAVQLMRIQISNMGLISSSLD